MPRPRSPSAGCRCGAAAPRCSATTTSAPTRRTAPTTTSVPTCSVPTSSGSAPGGSTIVPLAEIVDRLAAGRELDGLVAITFDDALLGVLEHAAPILEAHRVPATVFVVTDVVGVDPPFWPGAARTLTTDELPRAHRVGPRHARIAHRDPRLAPRRRRPTSARTSCASSRAWLEDLTARAGRPVRVPVRPPRRRERGGDGRGRLPRRVHVHVRPGHGGDARRCDPTLLHRRRARQVPARAPARACGARVVTGCASAGRGGRAPRRSPR